jgi:hypothetical protein
MANLARISGILAQAKITRCMFSSMNPEEPFL